MSDKKNLRTALYCRLACKDDERMDAQRQKLREYAEQNGYVNCEEYIDNGASGISSDRLAFVQMNEDIRAGHIGTVLIWDVARLFRDYILLGEWLNDVRTRGLSVISAQDGPLDDVLRPFRQRERIA